METPVQNFFKRYAVTLLSLSPEDIAAYYHTPLTIYADSGVLTVTKHKDVAVFWKEGVKQYEALHIEKTIPEIIAEEKLTEMISTAKVRWVNYDALGKKLAEETNFYILTAHKDGLKISGLIITGK